MELPICLTGLVGELLNSNYHGNWVRVDFAKLPPVLLSRVALHSEQMLTAMTMT